MSLTEYAAGLSKLWAAGWPYLHVEGLDEDRALRAVQAAAKLRGATLHRWAATTGYTGRSDLVDPREAVDAFAAAPGPAVAVMHDLHVFLSDQRLVRRLRDLAPALAEAGKCIALVSPPFEPPVELGGELVSVAVPAPTPGELRALLEALLGTAAGVAAGGAAGAAAGAAGAADGATDAGAGAEAGASPVDRGALVTAALGLSGTAARRAFRTALSGPAAEAVQAVLTEKQRHLREAFALEVLTPEAGFSEVGGLEGLKGWLDERERAFTAEARSFGLPAPRGALLLGVQGCGKSLSAKAVAAHWRLPLLRLDLAAVFGGGMPPERALKRALGLSEQFAPAVLWIDEIEKGFAGSDPEAAGGEAAAARVLGAFTTWLQEKRSPVFVVATANEVKSLPPELLRRGRFDEVFFVDLPDERARGEIVSVHLRRRGRDPQGFPVARLAAATEHFSGAELEQVVVSGLYRAFGAGRNLDADDLIRAATDTVPLYRTYEERVKALRAWAKGRARPAGRAEAVIDLLRGGGR